MSAGPDPSLAAAVGAALDQIADPCLAAAGIRGSIVDLGLVQSVRADTDGDVVVELSLTEMGCAFTHHLLDRVWAAVEGLEGVHTATVTPIWTWTPAHMRDDLAGRLRQHAAALPDVLGRR
jgi:metal-sulfur cluster biosynthetic enzyme